MTTSAPISHFQWWYGRAEPPLAFRTLRAGPVTANLVGRDLRNLRFGGAEIAQRIYVAVRDRNWDTVPGEAFDVTVEAGENQFAVRFTVTHRKHDIDFVWHGEILGAPDGAISYAMDATAGADMTYKLIGLNIHHGMREYIGRAFHGVTPDGPIAGIFPTDVEPQLVADETEVPIFPAVERLAVQLDDDISVQFDFAGDTFEFEDQRNWTDASFKSQSYPPRRGGFMTIRAGERVWQKVMATPSGTPPPHTADDGPVRIELGETLGRIPPIGLGMASHGGGLSERECGLLQALKLGHLRTDLRLADPDYSDELARAMADARMVGSGLELALHLTNDADEQLGRLATQLRDETCIDRVLVFHEAELATDSRWVDLARRRLGDRAPGALFAGGSNADFCELNHFRPSGTPEDGIVYSVNPQTHAFDELSLTENLAGQAETVRTARIYGNGRPVVVSPITLKPRFNSAATSAAPELAPGELPPQVDPRQMSLFGAGWTVGSLKRLIESGVAAATYYETTGWRGVIQGEAPSPVPEQFPSRPGMVFPVYHVFADLAEWKDGEVVSSRSSDPLAVETLVVARDGMLHLLVANLTPEPRTATIDALSAEDVRARRLNADTVQVAAFDPLTFRSQAETMTAHGPLKLTLAPFEVARLDARRSTKH
jgi:D-apionolactonase